ncbi:MAG: DUF3488 and transglutaminase-like domain-containing protein [Acidimicrobiales bacterium]
MTTTLSPPAETPTPAPDASQHRPSDAPGNSAPLLAMAEVALAAITVAAVVGLGRLFEDGSFLLPVLTVAAGSHLVAGWCRRRGLSPATTSLIALAGLAAVVSWIFLPATTAYGLPTPASLSELGEQLSSALATFREVQAPAPVEPGFVVASAIGVWVIAFVADTAAFRARATLEAAIPGATLFVFGAALGAPRHRELTTALFLAGVLAYWLAQRALSNASSPTWLSRDTLAGSRSLLRTGGVLGAAAVAAAVLLGPMLPGATADAVIPWRASDREDGGSRVTVSPLVDIQARIVDQAESVVFTVESPSRSYWRLTSLETFDGRIWSSSRSYKEVRGDLPAGTRLDPISSTTVTQEFEIGALASIWLPAAYRPVGVEGTEASYDAESASLIVPEDLELTEVGQRYAITSVLPDLTSELLSAVPAVAPQEVTSAYTSLPGDFSPAVRQEAFRITEPATTQYAKALALQDHFRGGAFTYDLDIERGHSGDALERFLFETRAGYCEQFAGAYAAMARAVGLPARIAVGFTPGEPDADGRLVVRGANGHAWPEVYLEGYGWVPFEPTPGRGIPGAVEYTGVPEQQATLEDPLTATTVPPTTAPPDTPGGETPDTLPDVRLDDALLENEPTVAVNPWPRRLLIAMLVLLGVPALWVGLVAAAGRLFRSRRRAAATTPEERVGLSWVEAGEALDSVGVAPRPWETPSEVAARAARAPGVDPASLRDLAGTVTTAAYGPGGVEEETADLAGSTAVELVRSTRATWDRRQHVRAAVDIRPYLPRRTARRRVSAAPMGGNASTLTDVVETDRTDWSGATPRA